MNTLRTLVLLEPPMRDKVQRIARKCQVSVSSVCRDFIARGIELAEDEYFEKVASERDSKFDWKTKGVSHLDAWAKTVK